MLLNERRSSLSYDDINKTKEKLYKKEVIYDFLKGKEQKDSLTNEEKKLLKKLPSILRIFKAIWTNCKNINTILHMA